MNSRAEIIQSMREKCRARVSELRHDLEVELGVLKRLDEEASAEHEHQNPQTESITATLKMSTRRGGRRPRGTLVPGSLMHRIQEVLKASDSPMRAPEIANRLTADGFKTEASAGLAVAVSSALAHASGRLFRRIGPGTYTIKRPESAGDT